MLTGQCYCGATTIRAESAPQSIAYCHCPDCRRVTGAPVAVFAAFDASDVSFSPDEGKKIATNPGVTRSFCRDCGSLLCGVYDYLPNQLYIPVGLFDQVDALIPGVHAHEANRVSWLHIEDDLPRFEASARSHLASATAPRS